MLTSYNGQSITYDAIGNPLTYNNGYAYTMTWSQSRNLASLIRGSNTLTYEYNNEGIRTSQTINGVKIVGYEYDAWGKCTVNLYVTSGTNIYASA